MNTPPDHAGGERSPIALTVPDPNEPSCAQNAAIADGVPPAETSGDPRQKRLLSKAAYRARRSDDAAFRESERQRVREWRRKNPDKTRAQKQAARSANYHRPFVAIDSEGQAYPGDDIVYDGVRYPKHETYLWGAASDDGRPPFWLMAAETQSLDKRPLDASKSWIGCSACRRNSDLPCSSCFRSATT